MKKPLVSSIAVIVMAGAALAILRFGFSGGEDTWLCENGQWVKHGSPSAAKPTTGCGTAQNSGALVNAPVPNVTYAAYAGQGSLYTFDTVQEWTSIAPAEIQKSIPVEQRHGYAIQYFASNADAVTFSVSEKQSAELSTMAAIVADDKSVAQTNQSITWVNQSLGQSDARTELKQITGSTQYTVYSRYFITFSGAAETRWALMEVAVPASRTSQYSSVVSHLLDSLTIAPASTNTNSTAQDGTFSATGEKVNDPVYRDNFDTIELGVLAKNAAPTTAQYGQSRLNYQTQQLSYHIQSSAAFADNSQMTVKAYDYAAGKLFDGSQSLTVRPGENNSCCYSPPGQGRYQYLFYLGPDLVKTLDVTSE